MNIHSTGAESFVCENWNSGNPSMVSFAGHESNTQKQFWDWETNHNNNNNSNRNHGNPPYIINPTTNNIFDRNCNNTLTSYSSSPPFASSFPTNLIPYSQFSHYSSTDLLKREEEDNFGGVDGGSNSYVSGGRIGLNLGHRTYFSSQETAVIDRLFRRPRGFYQTHQVPRCQAEGCRTDLSNAKHYHRRHKVCEFHSKATKVVAAGLEQRFCQQCSRFHLLSEFDEAKRSCRKRLADHNRRRRKPQTGSSDSSVPAKPAENAFPQMGSSVSKSEIMEKTRTFTGDSTSSVKETVTNGPDLSLGGEQDHQISYSVAAAAAAAAAATHQRSFIFNNNNNNNSYSSSSTALFQRENSFSSYNNLFMSTSNEASQSTGGVSEQTQHPEDMQNLLHLGQAMFGVELL